MASLADLSTYPEWASLVSAAEPDADHDTTWMVTLRARLGPLARSKRLRMTRTQLDDHMVRFERDEIDGRDHAEWILTASVEPTGANTAVEVHLHYGGTLWTTPLEAALAAVESSAAKRLATYLQQS